MHIHLRMRVNILAQITNPRYTRQRRHAELKTYGAEDMRSSSLSSFAQEYQNAILITRILKKNNTPGSGEMRG
jgi:hypothetical protein